MQTIQTNMLEVDCLCTQRLATNLLGESHLLLSHVVEYISVSDLHCRRIGWKVFSAQTILMHTTPSVPWNFKKFMCILQYETETKYCTPKLLNEVTVNQTHAYCNTNGNQTLKLDQYTETNEPSTVNQTKKCSP